MNEGAISIPCYYRSQVCPISSQALWNEVKLGEGVGFKIFIE